MVPNDFAILDGADNTIIDGVFHSMAGHDVGAMGESNNLTLYPKAYSLNSEP